MSDDYPNADLQSRSEYIEDQAAQVDQIVNLMYGLLALAVMIALFSIANSISLSIHERTRELGLVRAVGHDQAPDGERRPVGGRHRRPPRHRARRRYSASFFGWAISVTLRDERPHLLQHARWSPSS